MAGTVDPDGLQKVQTFTAAGAASIGTVGLDAGANSGANRIGTVDLVNEEITRSAEEETLLMLKAVVLGLSLLTGTDLINVVSE